MGLDWTTFALEIVNFLALVWILKRFLYRPVLATIAQRRAGIERVLDEARETHARASLLRSQFESRLADWEQEKAAARDAFDAQLAAERERQTEALSRDLSAERERSAAQDAHRQEALQREFMAEASTAAQQFARELLTRIAGPELEARLVELFIEDLGALPEQRLGALRAGSDGAGQGVFASAYPLSQAQRGRLASAVETRLGMQGHFGFVEDRGLLAGVRLSIGAWQLDFSLAGELGVFAEISQLAH